MWGAIGSIGGGLLSGAGSLFGGGGGGSGGSKWITGLNKQLAGQSMQMQLDALAKYSGMYKDYYWPIEEFLAGNYLTDIKQGRPYEERMRDYLLQRGDENIALANETNPLLDENKKDVIKRLTEGEDVLADRYRTDASADVTASFAGQRAQDQRRMNMAGVNPNSGAFTNYMNTSGTSEALAQAGSRTAASRQAEDTSLQRQMQAESWRTNPNMMWNAGTISPGMSIGQLTGGGGGGGSYGSSGGSSGGGGGGGGDMWGGLGGAMGGIFGGLDKLFPFGGGGGGAAGGGGGSAG